MVFAWLNGWDVVVLLGVVLIIFGAQKLPSLGRGFGQGLRAFRQGLDEEARDAGESLGGIYGKGAAQALTPDNQVAELYDPAALQPRSRPPTRAKRWLNSLRKFWSSILHRLRKGTTTQ